MTQNVMHASLCHKTSVGTGGENRWGNRGKMGGQEGQVREKRGGWGDKKDR